MMSVCSILMTILKGTNNGPYYLNVVVLVDIIDGLDARSVPYTCFLPISISNECLCWTSDFASLYRLVDVTEPSERTQET